MVALRAFVRVAHLFTALRNSPPRLLSTASTSSVLVYFERPVRPLLRAAGGRRKERVAVDPLAPLDSLTDHIAAKLNDGADATHMAAVLLLTDGQPNVIPPRGHVPMLQQYKDEHDLICSISTFGFGYRLDSPLLRDLAREGDFNDILTTF